jgi:ATP diphosphatase
MIEPLLQLMATLRDPEIGCPWDVAQTSASIVPYTLEEAYEVADAVAQGDPDALRDELGDLLLQVVFHARMAEEAGAFTFADVVAAIVAKMIRRHPHVFTADGDVLPAGAHRQDADAVARQWETIKAQERATRLEADARPLGDIAAALPALTRAHKLSTKAARYGFDWPNAPQVVAKVREEIDEVEEAMAAGDAEATREEIGDLLFSVANLARHLGIDPEYSLREGNIKFERRFTAMAKLLSTQGNTLESSDLPEMEAAWNKVKRAET